MGLKPICHTWNEASIESSLDFFFITVTIVLSHPNSKDAKNPSIDNVTEQLRPLLRIDR